MEILARKDAFLGEEGAGTSYDDAQVVIIPFGLEASVSYGSGTANGPQAMLQASPQLEMFDEQLWCEPCRNINIVTLKEPIIERPISLALKQLEQIVGTVVQDGKFPMVFGGEHSITAGSIRPFSEKYSDLAILHFDAHADLRNSYDDEPYSHACALRRCLDDAEVAQNGSHITLVSCGIRNISAEEIPFLENNSERIHIYWAKDQKTWNIKDIASHIAGKPVYLTFDVDGFDASLMPATGTPEPGGLFWNDAISIITEVANVSHIVGADVNELAPIKGWHACDFLAAKLAYKILSLAFARNLDSIT